MRRAPCLPATVTLTPFAPPPDELPASTTEHFDFQSWCMSVGLPAFDENLHKSLPAPLARYSPPAPHPTPVTPALDYSPLVYNSPSSSSFDQLDTPLESFLAVGPTPFHGLGVPAAEEFALLRRTMGLGTEEGQQQEQSAGWDVGEGSGSSYSDVGAGDQWRGPIEPAATSTSPQASAASPPAKRQRVSARKLATGIPQIYNGSGFSQNKERLLAAKREATPAPLPTDEKEKKREVNRRAAEASRKRKRKFVEGLQERISRLEDQLRSEGLVPVD